MTQTFHYRQNGTVERVSGKMENGGVNIDELHEVDAQGQTIRIDVTGPATEDTWTADYSCWR